MLFFHRQNSSAFAGNKLHRREKGTKISMRLAFMREGVSVDWDIELFAYTLWMLDKCKAGIEVRTYLLGTGISADQDIRDMH